MNTDAEGPVFGEDFDAFMAYLRAPGCTTISLERYATVLDIDMETLAAKAGVHLDAVARASHAAKLQQFLWGSIRVLHAATNLTGSVEETLYWFSSTPLQSFDYKTAEVLVSEGRTEALLSYLSSLDRGFAG